MLSRLAGQSLTEAAEIDKNELHMLDSDTESSVHNSGLHQRSQTARKAVCPVQRNQYRFPHVGDLDRGLHQSKHNEEKYDGQWECHE